MFKYILEGAGDINWMAIFALLTFMILFLISTVALFFQSPAHIKKMSNMPLDDSQQITVKNHEK